jgi:guanylate kinase
MSTGKLVILSGPSGVGKDTVINAWHEVDRRVERVVAYTTRQPRAGEIEGVDYHFVSRVRFEEMAEAGEFLEYKEVHGNYYATPLKDLEKLLSDGCIAVLKIDVQGALSVMALRPDALSVFLLPPSGAELERRIRVRALDGEADILRRLENARAELAMSDRYDYRITNDRIDQVVGDLQKLIASATPTSA